MDNESCDSIKGAASQILCMTGCLVRVRTLSNKKEVTLNFRKNFSLKLNLCFRVIHNMDIYVLIWSQAQGSVREGEKGGIWHTFPTPQMFLLSDWCLKTKKRGSVQPISTFCHPIWSLPHDQKRFTELKAKHLQYSRTQYWSKTLTDCLLYKLTSTAA